MNFWHSATLNLDIADEAPRLDTRVAKLSDGESDEKAAKRLNTEVTNKGKSK